MRGTIELHVPGKPMGKQRARWSKRGTYTPKETVNYETYIKELFVVGNPGFIPPESPVRVRIYISMCLSIPNSASKRTKDEMESCFILPTKRPDVDNAAKIVLDALESVAYKNDSQVVALCVEKFYSVRPRMDITIEYDEWGRK